MINHHFISFFPWKPSFSRYAPFSDTQISVVIGHITNSFQAVHAPKMVGHECPVVWAKQHIEHRQLHDGTANRTPPHQSLSQNWSARLTLNCTNGPRNAWSLVLKHPVWRVNNFELYKCTNSPWNKCIQMSYECHPNCSRFRLGSRVLIFQYVMDPMTRS